MKTCTEKINNDICNPRYDESKGEDKAEIAKALLPVLQKTRNLNDLVSLDYEKSGSGDEYIIATFVSGSKKTACVSGDSGTSLITDLLKAII